jgi:hypothetical protein
MTSFCSAFYESYLGISQTFGVEHDDRPNVLTLLFCTTFLPEDITLEAVPAKREEDPHPRVPGPQILYVLLGS